MSVTDWVSCHRHQSKNSHGYCRACCHTAHRALCVLQSKPGWLGDRLIEPVVLVTEADSWYLLPPSQQTVRPTSTWNRIPTVPYPDNPTLTQLFSAWTACVYFTADHHMQWNHPARVLCVIANLIVFIPKHQQSLSQDGRGCDYWLRSFADVVGTLR